MLDIDILKNIGMLNVGKLKQLLADVPDEYQIGIVGEEYVEVTNNVRVDVIDSDFGYVVFGGEPKEEELN